MTNKRKPSPAEQERLEKLLAEKIARAVEDAQQEAEHALFSSVIEKSNLDPALKKALLT